MIQSLAHVWNVTNKAINVIHCLQVVLHDAWLLLKHHIELKFLKFGKA